MPSSFATPGRKASTKTSAFPIKSLNTSMPFPDFRFSRIPFLFLFEMEICLSAKGRNLAYDL